MNLGVLLDRVLYISYHGHQRSSISKLFVRQMSIKVLCDLQMIAQIGNDVFEASSRCNAIVVEYRQALCSMRQISGLMHFASRIPVAPTVVS